MTAKVLLVSVVGVLGALTAPFGAPEADACSLVPTFAISIEDLAAGDPDNLFAHLQADYVAWSHDVFGEPSPGDEPVSLPALTGVWYERAVVAVDPPADHYASTGGVTVVDAIWGQAQDPAGPIPLGIDTSSCAGQFPLPEPGAFHLVTEGDAWVPIHLEQPRTADQVDTARDIFDLAFGEPEAPPRAAAAEVEALNQVLMWAVDAGVGNHEPARWIDPISPDVDPAAEEPATTTTEPTTTIAEPTTTKTEPTTAEPGNTTSETAARPSATSDGGGTSAGVMIAIGIAALAGVAALAVGLRSRP